jgi:hypothetical protein
MVPILHAAAYWQKNCPLGILELNMSLDMTHDRVEWRISDVGRV